ncbi:hypothetical protein R1flu_008959 [Riccia fluitans]|uniref:Uncharacterized protein n=1 Tax=Riccia fluitans TaxID=41844 RepID=A0ABD1Z4V4_9MARC
MKTGTHYVGQTRERAADSRLGVIRCTEPIAWIVGELVRFFSRRDDANWPLPRCRSCLLRKMSSRIHETSITRQTKSSDRL